MPSGWGPFEDMNLISMIPYRGVFSTGAMGALAGAIFGHISTVGENCGC